MSLSIKKGDNVLVIAGKDKGKTGEVLSVVPANNSVVVAGVNIVSKHKKARSAQEKSAIVKKEARIDASNVQLVCPVCGKRLCKAEEGSVVEMQCPACKEQVEVVVTKNSVQTSKCKKEAV